MFLYFALIYIIIVEIRYKLMTTLTQPLTAGNILISPFLEAKERWLRGSKGINFHHIAFPSLSWKERVVSCMTAFALSIPILNAIIWIVWKWLGSPELLSSAGRVVVDSTPSAPPCVIQPWIPPTITTSTSDIPLEQEQRPLTFRYVYENNQDGLTEYTITRHSNGNIKESSQTSPTSKIKTSYNENGQITSCEGQTPSSCPQENCHKYATMTMDYASGPQVRINGREIDIRRTIDTQVKLPLDPSTQQPLPLIADPTFTLWPFLQDSQAQQFSFCSLNPLPYGVGSMGTLVKMLATISRWLGNEFLSKKENLITIHVEKRPNNRLEFICPDAGYLKGWLKVTGSYDPATGIITEYTINEGSLTFQLKQGGPRYQ
jgi:hypothetical protein